MHERLDRRIRWRPPHSAFGIVRRHHRLLVAQLIKEQPVGRHFLRRIQPGQACAHARQRDHVIELRGRRLVLIELARTVDQHGITLNPHRLQHRGQQRVLVLAVAVTVFENVGRRVRLIAADAQRDAHVANVERHEVVQAPRLFFGSRRALGESPPPVCARCRQPSCARLAAWRTTARSASSR